MGVLRICLKLECSTGETNKSMRWLIRPLPSDRFESRWTSGRNDAALPVL